MPSAGPRNHPSRGSVSRRKSARPNVHPDCIGPFLGAPGKRSVAPGRARSRRSGSIRVRDGQACARVDARRLCSAHGATLTSRSDLVLRRRSDPDIKIRPPWCRSGGNVRCRRRCSQASASRARHRLPDCASGPSGSALRKRNTRVWRSSRCNVVVGARPRASTHRVLTQSAHTDCSTAGVAGLFRCTGTVSGRNATEFSLPVRLTHATFCSTPGQA
jgi:hypothetical protein